MDNLFTTSFNTPLGYLQVTGTAEFITSVWFVEEPKPDSTAGLPEVITNCVKELQEYFEGNRQVFSVPIGTEGTEFQRRVWHELELIPFGETCSYLDIARKLNDENSTRAVGTANGKNPIAIILPCHRVIGENGKLTGYAGGMWRKSWLLEHEGKVSGKRLSLF
ncbi:MAG: methylated-DNA--[protein]-cysteine S-methyltransferase [Chitinophagales bacterium]